MQFFAPKPEEKDRINIIISDLSLPEEQRVHTEMEIHMEYWTTDPDQGRLEPMSDDEYQQMKEKAVKTAQLIQGQERTLQLPDTYLEYLVYQQFPPEKTHLTDDQKKDWQSFCQKQSSQADKYYHALATLPTESYVIINEKERQKVCQALESCQKPLVTIEKLTYNVDEAKAVERMIRVLSSWYPHTQYNTEQLINDSNKRTTQEFVSYLKEIQSASAHNSASLQNILSGAMIKESAPLPSESSFQEIQDSVSDELDYLLSDSGTEQNCMSSLTQDAHEETFAEIEARLPGHAAIDSPQSTLSDSELFRSDQPGDTAPSDEAQESMSEINPGQNTSRRTLSPFEQKILKFFKGEVSEKEKVEKDRTPNKDISKIENLLPAKSQFDETLSHSRKRKAADEHQHPRKSRKEGG